MAEAQPARLDQKKIDYASTWLAVLDSEGGKQREGGNNNYVCLSLSQNSIDTSTQTHDYIHKYTKRTQSYHLNNLFLVTAVVFPTHSKSVWDTKHSFPARSIARCVTRTSGSDAPTARVHSGDAVEGFRLCFAPL